MANNGICSNYVLRGETCVEDLPDECLYNVFKFLNNRADRDAFGLTCHCWLKIQSGVRHYIRFEFPNDASQSYRKYLIRLLDRFPALQSVSLVGCTGISDSALTAFQSAGLKLQKLALDCCFSITDEGLSHICDGCTTLVSLSLYRCSTSDTGLEYVAISCPSLEIINLSYCQGISDSGIAVLGKGCPRLKVVTISFCRNIQGQGFEKYLSLEYLEADSCRLTDVGLSAIVNGGFLQYLNLSHPRNWTGYDLRGFSCIGMSCPKLQFLHLRMCRTLDDSAVIEISRGCPLLKEWNMAVCTGVTVAGWEAVAMNCRNLEVLHVNRCRYFCDRSLLFLKNGCPKLSSLYLNGCPKLSSLYLHGCPNLNDMTLEIFKQGRSAVHLVYEECMVADPCVDKFVQKQHFAVRMKNKISLSIK